MDSLRYWVTECHVDGFRFDLASALAREFFDVGRLSAFFDVDPPGPGPLAGEADRRAVGHRPGWLPGRQLPGAVVGVERRVPRRDARLLAAATRACGTFASRLPGSSDIYREDGRDPFASINFVTAPRRLHARRPRRLRAQAQRGQQRGQPRRHRRQPLVELRRRGPDRRPGSSRCARRQQRNFLTTLLLSQGTPMLLGGDELGRTQHGNNNAWCQDNEISWYDWTRRRTQRSCCAVHQAPDRAAPRAPVIPARELPDRRASAGAPACRMPGGSGPDGRSMSDADWQDGRARARRSSSTAWSSRDPAAAASRSPTTRSCSCSTRSARTARSCCPAAASEPSWALELSTGRPRGGGRQRRL